MNCQAAPPPSGSPAAMETAASAESAWLSVPDKSIVFSACHSGEYPVLRSAQFVK